MAEEFSDALFAKVNVDENDVCFSIYYKHYTSKVCCLVARQATELILVSVE